MSRCPLCKTTYADGVRVCKIDGTPLSQGVHTSPVVALPAVELHNKQTGGLSDSDIRSVMASPVGKRRGLASMSHDEVTAAANVGALAREREEPPRIATGSGTVAPKSKSKDEWSKPFLDLAPSGLDSQNSEDWLGQTLGSYKLISILGKGGMGCVYRAEHTKLGREVALKVLRSDYAKRKDAVARFFQEARAVNKVRHRNIVDVTDLIELDSGIVFIIMEYLEGTGLTQVMRASSEGIERVRALSLVVQICDGLAAAHSVGIVHRDLKPDNIIVTKDSGGKDLIKLLDFGVAKLLDKDDDDDLGLMTVAGSVVGTPAYMSPEQAGGLQVDGRADIYSLGAIMYEIFTRQPLFRGKSFGEYVRLHLNEAPLAPTYTAGGRDLDPRIEEVILMCLEKSPDARFQTAHELRAELLSLLSCFETSGEMTAHLTKLSPSAKPSGAALPPGRESIADLIAESSVISPPSQEILVPPFYSPGAQGEPPRSLSQPQPGTMQDGSRPMPMPGYVPHSYSTGTPMPIQHYRSEPHMAGYPAVANQSSIHPPPRNYRGVGVGVAIGLAAVIALIIAADSSDEGSNAAGSLDEQAALAGDGNVAEEELDEIDPEAELAVPSQTTNDEVKPNEDPDTRFVVVQITSEPPAELFAAGAASSICTTPCPLKIDSTDGGSPDRRDYFLRQADYVDTGIAINLRAPRKEVFVTLEAKEKPVLGKLVPVKVRTPKRTDSKRTDSKRTDSKRTDSKRTDTKRTDTKKPKCKAGAQDTFNPFGDDAPCQK